ncbi:MAG TPA: valine--tRNA ligase, partial [Candidatus Acidoferrales bacterium]|nr:valine--tRNA ligase [Candidatus Acidoferrales bacterium]
MATLEKTETTKKFLPRIAEKRWDHNVEMKIFDQWQQEGAFRFKPGRGRKLFVIDTPPPTTSGNWHIGAVAAYSQIDMIARSQRMQGKSVLFPIGFDRNGINVEIYVEKHSNVKMRDTPREQFIDICSHALDELEAQIMTIMKRVGLSGDYERRYHTDHETYRKFTQATFIEFWKKGLIYETTRPNNYCHDCGTTIADAEVEYEDLPSNLAYVVSKIEETGETLVIATTRPELICACQLVIVNPTDERYTKLHGMHAILPIYGRKVQIKPHPSAKPEFGTGAVMVCSYGDYTDVLLFRELSLAEILAVGPDGRLTAAAGSYQGLTMKEGRSRILEDLRSQGLLVKTENIRHRTPVCSRSNTPIEIIPMKEYYLKQIDFIPKLKQLAKRITFHPNAARQILLDWINSIAIDWPISRRRVYATEIPVWYCKNCGTPFLPPPGEYYRPWRDQPPSAICSKCGLGEFEGDTRTFDTWMDSSVSALYISKYPFDSKFFKRAYPASLRPQGKDIVRTWLHYSILRCYQLTGRAPFTDAWINGLGMDEQGQAMHKSKGNVVEPEPVLEKFGADAFRFWNASEATLGSDFRCSEMRIAAAHKFMTKLWNLSRFISSFPQVKNAKLQPSDKWILSELTLLIQKSMKGYRDYNFFVPSTAIRDFVWETFASHYLEMVKPRAYGQGFTKAQQKAAWYTLHTVLSSVLLLLAPITPFMPEYVWRQLYSKRSIHEEEFPKPAWSKASKRYTEKMLEFNRKVWKIKKEKNLALRDPVEVRVPKALAPFTDDLV